MAGESKSWVTSGQILAALQETHSEVQTKHWKNAAWKALRWRSRESYPEEFIALLRGFRYIPDAYAVSSENRSIDFFEIEVTHPLPKHKLDAYVDLWMDFDYYRIEFTVYVVNRYGHITPLDLQGMWYRDLAKRRDEKSAEAVSAHPTSHPPQPSVCLFATFK